MKQVRLQRLSPQSFPSASLWRAASMSHSAASPLMVQIPLVSLLVPLVLQSESPSVTVRLLRQGQLGLQRILPGLPPDPPGFV